MRTTTTRASIGIASSSDTYSGLPRFETTATKRAPQLDISTGEVIACFICTKPAIKFGPSFRKSTVVAVSQNRTNPPVKAPSLIVMQVAGKAEGVAADIDIALQHISALLGIADDADAGTWPRSRQTRPQMRSNPIAVGAAQFLHPLVGD